MLLRVIDLETTGLEPPEHGVCEIGWSDVVSVEHDLLGAPTAWKVLNGGGMLVNPGRSIPPESSAIHHIVDEDVVDSPTFQEVVSEILHNNGYAAAFVAHNAKFEKLFIGASAHNIDFICTYKCALRLWPDAPAHSNQALRYWRRPEGLDREIAFHAHRAFPDAYVTAFHLRDGPIEREIEEKSRG